MLANSIEVELQKMATGVASDQKLRTLPTCISEFSQRIKGIYDLSRDLEVTLPNGLREALNRYLSLIKKLFKHKKCSELDLKQATNTLLSLVEPWNPLPSRGLNHKKRRTTTAVLLFQTIIIHTKHVKTERAERLLKGFGFHFENVDQSILEPFWRLMEENRGHRLMEFTKFIGKSHVYLTVMEMIGFIHLTADLPQVDDERVLDFFQTYPWYFAGPSSAAFMEMLRHRCFEDNRIGKKKARKEHPVLMAIARIELDLPTGIRERCHATLPAEYPSILGLFGLIVSGGLWGRGFSERLMRFFRWGDQPFTQNYLDRVLKIFENMRYDSGAKVSKLFSNIGRFEGQEPYYEFIKIAMELMCHNPTNYLAIRNGVYKCSLPFFDAYSHQ